MNKKTISVVIPTCDRKEFLLLAVGSVLDQSLQPDEILIINNGSGEVDLPELLYEKVKLIDTIAYAGAAQARNFGATVAKGEIIAFLDDDDLWGKKYLANVAYAFENGARCCVSRLDQMIGESVVPMKNADGKMTLDNLYVLNPGVTGSNIVIEKKLFFEAGGFDPKLPPSEDKSLLIEIVQKGIKVTTLPENQAIIRQHNTGPRLTDSEKQIEGYTQFLKKYGTCMGLTARLGNYLKLYQALYRSRSIFYIFPFITSRVAYKIVRIFKTG